MQNAENEVVTVDGGEEELIDRFKFLKTQRTDIDQSQWQPEPELLFPTDFILRSIGVRWLHLRNGYDFFLYLDSFIVATPARSISVRVSEIGWISEED